MTKKRELIALLQLRGVGPVMARKLLEKAVSVDDIFSEFDNDEVTRALAIADEIITKCNRINATIIDIYDSDYPSRFKDIHDAPMLIYCIGDVSLLSSHKTVGIIGARRCSVAGKQKAIDITKEYTENKTVVISGMAKGIDSYAHTACIKLGGKTVAILGNGIDLCYPKEHSRLFEEIKDIGLAISEYPPGTPPTRYAFSKRNRLIAALSDSLCVIEAKRRSGTNITVDYAQKYGKNIYKYMCEYEGELEDDN